MVVDPLFWQGKKVLITGHTGFKGGWLSLWLQSMGADVVGIALDSPTKANIYQQADVADGMHGLHIDIRGLDSVKKVFQENQPEIVFHLAAQSLVGYSYSNPVETYQTNVMGTINILEAIKCIDSVRSVVMVTTDKCYENKEWDWGYRENEPMGGYDPYSSSKGCAELLISSYRNSYFSSGNDQNQRAAIASARAGNVIGGGDWANNRLIPDIIRAFERDAVVKIRNPAAIRPWQHVLEPLAGYIKLAKHLFEDGERYVGAWNFGPSDADVRSVEWIAEFMTKTWGNGVTWEVDGVDYPHEATYLKLDCSKAHAKLSWWPKWGLEYALRKIIEWHKEEMAGSNMRKMTISHINEYMNSSDI